MNPAFIHLNGDVDSGFQAQNTTTGACISFLANRGGNNGIYDEVKGKWYQRWSQTDGSGHVHGGDKSEIWTDNEGGNLELISPDGSLAVQMDLCDNNQFRVYIFKPDPWTWLASFRYIRSENIFECTEADFNAPNLRENNVRLSDKYMRQGRYVYANTHALPAGYAANSYLGMNLMSFDTWEQTRYLCVIDITFMLVPANGSITFWIGAGNSTDWLYTNYNNTTYPSRKKLTVSNDSSATNSVSASVCLYINGYSNLRLDILPNFAYGAGTSFTKIVYMATLHDD